MAKKIALDAGHGGKDPGALGPSNTKEKDFALTMVQKVEQRLKKNKKVSTILTRDNDTFLELSERVNIAKKKKVDIFVSIHANSSNNVASGTETYYTREDSRALADIMHKHLVEATGLRDRKVKRESLQVTRETNMPAVLLEVGFINHPEDEKKLFDSSFQDRVADAIVAGIYEYFDIIVEAPKPEVPSTKEMAVTVHTDPVGRYIGYNIKNTTWIPSRPIGEQLGGRIGYKDGKVTINGESVETQNIEGIGYVTARDLTKLLGARIFWDKKEPHKVDIFIK
ncbi:N-acetylmuramoyl-L-alanine amidase [Paenibacillus lactis]|uniref:N-acetylmuramoyl-L-alanine amidase n=1 Tax=Paenibacillus lactis TaxID=228574 RepID=UPI0036AFC3E3